MGPKQKRQERNRKGEKVGVEIEITGRWQDPERGRDEPSSYNLFDYNSHSNYDDILRPSHAMTTRSKSQANQKLMMPLIQSSN